MDYNGIEYSLPNVFKLQDSGIGVPEVAARTCYDSFHNSENSLIEDFPIAVESYMLEPDDFNWEEYTGKVNELDESGLLHDLAWAYHHHSILEHSTISYYIQGTSRGVLQEHARHRIQAISVRSTRYTMSDILYAFIIEKKFNISNSVASDWFHEIINDLDIFVTTEREYNKLQIEDIFKKLSYHYKKIGSDEFIKLSLSKDNIENLTKYDDADDLLEALSKGKKKRNAGDSFKHIVNDNWKVDMVVTFNLRSLKNYFGLRDSGAAWFQIQWLADEMKNQTPTKYMKLIDKKFKES